MSDIKPSAKTAMDVLLFAPLGFVFEARGLMPQLAERGRNQAAVARMLAQFALQQGQVEANKRLSPLPQQVESLLGDLGIVPRASQPPAPRNASPKDRSRSEKPGPAPMRDVSAPVRKGSADSKTNRAKPDVNAAALAIPDYDSLAASQVIPRLTSLNLDELALLEAYESSGRGRKTILNRIAQLQGT